MTSVVEAEGVHDVEAEQRDVRRLAQIAAGVEHDVDRAFVAKAAGILVAEACQQVGGHLHAGEHAYTLAHLAELLGADLALLVWRPAAGHCEARQRQHEAGVDAFRAGWDARAAAGADGGPSLGGGRAGPAGDDVAYGGSHGCRGLAAEACRLRHRADLEALAAGGAGGQDVVRAGGEGIGE